MIYPLHPPTPPTCASAPTLQSLTGGWSETFCSQRLFGGWILNHGDLLVTWHLLKAFFVVVIGVFVFVCVYSYSFRCICMRSKSASWLPSLGKNYASIVLGICIRFDVFVCVLSRRHFCPTRAQMTPTLFLRPNGIPPNDEVTTKLGRSYDQDRVLPTKFLRR